MDKRKERKIAQAERAARMQDKILEHLEMKLDDGTINATELKTTVDLLRSNGWDWSEALTSSKLADKLTKKIAYDDDIDAQNATLTH